MVTEDQTETIEYLSQPITHGAPDVERVDTHASVVFLAGDHALKLKRAVRYDYLDFSTSDLRRRMCEREFLLNRRTAPSLYEQMVPVTREDDGRLTLSGRGAVVDWLLRMRRFDQDALLDRLAERGALPLGLMAPLGEAIGRLHRSAAPRTNRGGSAGMADVIRGNATSFDEAPPSAIDHDLARRVTARQMEMVSEHTELLDARRQQGFVRYCHGDLHLSNLVLLDEQPTLFDGIEFNEDLACIDVLYDLAFLLMDLWRRRLYQHANALWNAYLAYTTDFAGLPPMPLFLSCRAAIRAKTSLATASLAQADEARAGAERLAREYLTLAECFLTPRPAVVIAIGGLSGSGKSTVARVVASELGRTPGAVIARSDVIRKGLCGVDPTTRLGPEGYSEALSQRVYAAVIERCRVVAETGYAVVADALFGHSAQREASRACASGAGVPFVGIWLDAPHQVLARRVETRSGDASDADTTVVTQQIQTVAPPEDWLHVDASRPLDAVVSDVLQLAGEGSAAAENSAQVG